MGGVHRKLQLAAVLITLLFSIFMVETQDQGTKLTIRNTIAHYQYLVYNLSAGGVSLELNGTRITSHGIVGPPEIETANGGPLVCVTPQSACCSNAENGSGSALPGNWYLPDGDPVSSDASQFVYTTRGQGMIFLQVNGSTLGERPRGIFRCELPDQTGVNQTLFVGLYVLTSQTSGKH